MGRHPVLIVALCAIGGGVGAAAGSLLPVNYTAETTIAVGHTDLTSQAQPGYALATQQLASNYARYVTNNDAMKQQYLDAQGAKIAASAIPESNLIRVEATSGDPETSEAVAADVANDLTEAVNKERASLKIPAVEAEIDKLAGELAVLQRSRDDLVLDMNYRVGKNVPVSRLTELSGQIAEADHLVQVKEVEKQAAVNQLGELNRRAVQEAELIVRSEPAVTGSTKSGTLQQGLILGMGLAGLAGLLYVMRKEKAQLLTHDVLGDADPSWPGEPTQLPEPPPEAPAPDPTNRVAPGGHASPHLLRASSGRKHSGSHAAAPAPRPATAANPTVTPDAEMLDVRGSHATPAQR